MIPYSEVKITSIEGSWTVQRIAIAKQFGLWFAKVIYQCKDSNGNLVDTFSIQYNKDEYNQWFNDFNSGTYLLEELKRVKGLEGNPEPDSETNFFNPENTPVVKDNLSGLFIF